MKPDASQDQNSYKSIFRVLMKLTLPIVGGSFLQMTYNFTDMIWVGKLGSDAVAAVGTAGFFTHMAWAFSSLALVGTGVKISHAVGRQDFTDARAFIKNGFLTTWVLGLIFMLFLILGSSPLIAFFKLNNTVVEGMAENYLIISALGILISYTNYLFAAIFNAFGYTKIPFKTNMVGLGVNMVLDPLFIFVLKWGVEGAAIATVIAQLVTVIIYWRRFLREKDMKTFPGRVHLDRMWEVLRLGFPTAAQRVIFTFIAIMMARIIAQWGATAIAVQKVGLQLESVTFMTVGGLHQAITTFVGQKYGAKDWIQLKKGYNVAVGIGVMVGFLVSLLFMLIPELLISIFLKEADSIAMGAQYLRIIGLSQIFMCMEMVTGGAMNGLGKTHIPATLSVILTGARIPLALWLSAMPALGLDGVWWSISLSSIAKGLVSVVAFYYLIKSMKEFQLSPLK
ncbi:MATE family efflux transporter [Sediminitomix flava]|uniref:Multidrug-efflux transporter n=1 Tax=Sediminitomix flava TaxID=379075 RepID=A0A315ZAH0_SEDFL|nr:MATE family efflux transporter [Sediminitomix flava]PWJ41080.1 putative MATE family efflux protein [Sediminitomix flava]